MAVGRTSMVAIERVGGIHAFMGVRGSPVIAATRDAALREFNGKAPRKAYVPNAVYVDSHKGGTYLTLDAYMLAVQAMQPDAYVTLSDELHTPASAKRTAASVSRSAEWVAACLEQHEALQLAGRSAVLAPIMGGTDMDQRARSVQAAVRLDARLDGAGSGHLAESCAVALTSANATPLQATWSRVLA